MKPENQIKIIEEYQSLKEQVILWNKSYFNYDNPLVEDAIYDAALLKLQNYENKYAFIDKTNSPTQNIGAQVSNKFTKVKHDKPMLSLNKAYNLADLKNFENQINKIGFFPKYFLDLKIDGLSISLKYKNGKLVQGLTRGDGIIGEDIINNIKQIADIPHQIDFLEDIEIRGEVYLAKSTFKKINQDILKEIKNLELKNEQLIKDNIEPKKINLSLFANPRNAASGTLRQLDSSIVKQRGLSAFLYTIVDPLQYGFKYYYQILKFLENNNFKVTPWNKEFDSIDKLYEIIKTFENNNLKNNFDFEIDGLVIKTDDFSIYDTIGFTSKFPKAMIAYKFSYIAMETKLNYIFATIGRTGRINYNASLDPIVISGSLVSFATLHNYDYIAKLNLNIGDNVEVIKAGEIIPKVLKVSQKNSDGVFNKILNCPSCNNILAEYEGEVDQYCINENCYMIKLRQIEHFASKIAMDINGLGFRIIEKFFNNNLIKDIFDIYHLFEQKEKIIELEFFGEKSYDNLIESINKSKLNSLDKFIFALGIKHIGQRASKIVAKNILSLDKFVSFDFNSLEVVRDISIKSIESLNNFVKEEKNIILINKFLSYDLNFKNSNSESASNIFENQIFVITGTLSKPRDYFKSLIIQNNGQVTNTISKNTKFLLCGTDPGSKYAKATQLNIEIINEEKFFELLKKD